jgi:xylulokinase
LPGEDKQVLTDRAVGGCARSDQNRRKLRRFLLYRSREPVGTEESMSCLLGIDLGTSSVKVAAFGVEGALKGIGVAEYPILTPRLEYAEQDPEQWWSATVMAVREALEKAGHPEVLGIGFSGQMHGLVLLDQAKRLVRPAIIWADQRSAHLLPEIEGRVGRSLLAERCGTAPTAGFAIASLYWLQKFEAQTLERAVTVMLPKDYLRFKLTGELGTDQSDAASSGLFDVGQRVWADGVIGRMGLPRSMFPKVHASADIVGPLIPSAAAELGLPPGIPVSAGCADQPAQAVGNGLLDPPLGSVTIGTGGQVFVPLTQPLIDPALRLHTFCHAAPARWYLLGAMLSAGMALRWLRSVLGREKSSYTELVQLAADVPPGSEGLTFLPYLVGERSPLMDPNAKAGFIGLALRHGPGHLVRALLEGVAFALRQTVDTMVGCGADLTRLVASGNGLANPIWRQIVADVLNRPLCQGTGEQASERAGVGAAMIAGIGAGVFKGYEEARKLAPVFTAVTEPKPSASALYESHYGRFVDAYPRLRGWF